MSTKDMLAPTFFCNSFREAKLDQTVTNTSSTSNTSDNREVTVNYGIREVSLK